MRYVHNNPVRAGIVPQAAASGWSSHRAYIGAEKAPPWLRLGEVLGMLATETEAARRAFVDFVDGGAEEKRRADFAGDAIEGVSRTIATEVGDAWRLSHPIVGDEVFAAKVLADLKKADEAGQVRFSGSRVRRAGRPELEALIVYTCEALGLERWEFAQSPRRRHPHTARLIVTWLWVCVFGGSQAAVARKLSTSAANVSNWYGSAVRHLPDIEPLMDAVMNALPASPEHAAWKTSSKVHYHLAIDDEPGPLV